MNFALYITFEYQQDLAFHVFIPLAKMLLFKNYCHPLGFDNLKFPRRERHIRIKNNIQNTVIATK